MSERINHALPLNVTGPANANKESPVDIAVFEYDTDNKRDIAPIGGNLADKMTLAISGTYISNMLSYLFYAIVGNVVNLPGDAFITSCVMNVVTGAHLTVQEKAALVYRAPKKSAKLFKVSRKVSHASANKRFTAQIVGEWKDMDRSSRNGYPTVGIRILITGNDYIDIAVDNNGDMRPREWSLQQIWKQIQPAVRAGAKMQAEKLTTFFSRGNNKSRNIYHRVEYALEKRDTGATR